MRLTLEKADLLQLLSMALNYELHDEEVEVKAEPFEVHLKTVRLLDLARASKPVPVAVQDKTRIPVARPGLPAPESASPEDLEDLLSQSASLAGAGLPSAEIDPDVKGMNDFARALRPGETEEPPGEDFSGEIPG
jgi:hypothetical protein